MNQDINKILTYIIYVLAGIIVFCTITAFLAGKASFGKTYRYKDPSGINELSKKESKDLKEYKEFGSLRAVTKPESDELSRGATLVVTPWFAYKNADSAFYEELSNKKKNISSIILSYFAENTRNELYSKGEKKVKAEIMSLINEQLVLGKIDAVYFDEYIFLD